MQFFSQVGQDRFVFENFFRGRRNGVFVDVGAYDGERFSNSLFFERFMGWRGLCVEPLPSAFSMLVARRNCISEQVCVADFEGEATFIESDAGAAERMLSGLSGQFDPRHVERMQRMGSRNSERIVPVRKLSSLLEKHSLFRIDYCSIDTEGAELSILGELDLNRFEVSVFTIENNYDDPRLAQVMADKGYDFVAKLEQDYVYKRRDAKLLPRTTVICAVGNLDEERELLLAGHATNLSRQTVPIEPIYVCAGGNTPSSSVAGRVVVAREGLSASQAYNLGLSLVETPFVMNLNLDDRLAPDGIAQLEAALVQEGAALAGGDWKVCYSQASADAVESCYPAERIPYVADWPPVPGTLTRLGSGTGGRATFGPATMWRMDVHLGAPRYPWRLPEGTPLQFVGDIAWWTLITAHLKKKSIRLGQVIGHYHSHSNVRAALTSMQEESALLRELGISLL